MLWFDDGAGSALDFGDGIGWRADVGPAELARDNPVYRARREGMRSPHALALWRSLRCGGAPVGRADDERVLTGPC